MAIKLLFPTTLTFQSTMFAYNTSPVYFFDALSNLQQLQLQQYREQQLAAQRPKIIKKVETEEGFQIQIHKATGNFQSYEVKVVKAYGNAKLVNLIIESKADDFSKVFQFSLDDIEVSEIDWEYFERENVLVLKVPKKVKFCTDDFANSVLCSLLGVPARQTRCHDETKRALKEQRREQRRIEKRARKAEVEASREAARLNALRLAEEARHAEELKEAARKAKEEELRKAEELRLAEVKRLENIRREEARRLEAEKRKEAERIARERTEQIQKEKEHDEMIRKQQEFLNQLFGGSVFMTGGAPPFVKVANKPQTHPVPVTREEDTKDSSEATQSSRKSPLQEQTTSSSLPKTQPKPSSSTEIPASAASDDVESDDEISTDSESILSDVDTPSPMKNTLHKHPSLEEVEDEEFVMFRKKFGDQK